MELRQKYLRNGFTLVELLITVSILSILAALIIIAFSYQLSKGNDAKRKSDLDRIKISLEEYEKDHDCYPSSMTECGAGSAIPVHPYLTNVPCDPVTREAYEYEAEGIACPSWYRLYSDLQNGDDLSILPGIGPGALYNYYVSSPNAPTPIATTPAPTDTPPPAVYYGCINKSCQEIPLGGNGLPICQPTYDDPACYHKCDNPTNDCLEENV